MKNTVHSNSRLKGVLDAGVKGFVRLRKQPEMLVFEVLSCALSIKEALQRKVLARRLLARAGDWAWVHDAT